MKVKNKVGFFCFALLLAGAFFFSRESEKSEPTENKLAENNLPRTELALVRGPQKTPRIIVSSEKLRQGDTLLVKVDSPAEAGEVKGYFGEKEIYFFKLDNSLISIVGIGTKKEPGKYDLVATLPNGNRLKKEINIEKTDWRVKKLKVTKELEEKGLTQPKIIENITVQDGPLVKEAVSSFTPEAYFAKPFIYPLKKIVDVGPFGDIRESPSGTLQHLGTDLDADTETSVFAINDGVVVFAKDLPTYGKTIIIDHGLGIFSLYLHLDDFKVEEGRQTKQGNIIGLSGNTGYSIGPHLHFSIKANNESVDPLKFIEIIEKEMR